MNEKSQHLKDVIETNKGYCKCTHHDRDHADEHGVCMIKDCDCLAVDYIVVDIVTVEGFEND